MKRVKNEPRKIKGKHTVSLLGEILNSRKTRIQLVRMQEELSKSESDPELLASVEETLALLDERKEF